MQIAIDPVCGVELEAEQAEGGQLYSDYEVMHYYLCSPCSERRKWRFYFCCPRCKTVFDAAPGFYSGLAEQSPSRPEQPQA